jgi:hypothetical protein
MAGRREAVATLALAGVLLLARGARAGDDAGPPPAPAAATTTDDSGDNPGLITPQRKSASGVRAEPEGHLHQVGLGLQLAVGMRAINPYHDTYCGQLGDNGSSNQAYCLARTPMTFDLELSYGVTPSIEALLEARIGVERDFGTAPGAAGPRVHQLAPGVRVFFSESGRAKFFSTVQAVLDTTSYEDDTGSDRGLDLGVRNVNGFWFDLKRSLGLYVFFGEEAGFKRWLSATLEAGLGVQGRYP